eukprot:TRINITY_DN6677_c0_g1_i2.p1 TRINITY_DN6677_c0_g1~~TRINITY_DN6677_c0_g1_i2.p1  ORF type:complete len:444 (-),score=118.14 TRINITY_DN6677_c0_g1_i2:53-1384(-)
MFTQRVPLLLRSSSNKRLLSSSHCDIAVVGAGTGGLAVASALRRKLPKKNIVILDAAQEHYYQPLWTLVGAGIKTFDQSVRKTQDLIPSGCHWISQDAHSFSPESNVITLESGETVRYGDALVVATGVELNLEGIKGLKETLGKNAVVSNYVPGGSTQTWEWAQRVQNEGGKAIFTFPSTPVKCGGAPQKIMYLLEDHYRSIGVRGKWEIHYYCALGKIFAADHYAAALNKLCDARKIKRHFHWDLVEVRGDKKEAVFKNMQDKTTEIVENFDFLHVTPHLRAASALRGSPLSNAAGFVDVNPSTLQSTKYPNVFALGDCSSLPTSKTAAAIAGQHPVLTRNLISYLQGAPMKEVYDGYTSCPLVTGKNKLILAEFDYNLQPKETFWFLDQREESALGYFMKKEIFPPMYWNGLITGLWEGPKQLNTLSGKLREMLTLKKVFE